MTKVIIESKKWFKEAVELVRNFDFDLHTVYDNSYSDKDVHNCQFCGQAIRYVAVIHGTPKLTTAATKVERSIGCDCLERVLGNTWKHYNSAMSQYKTLVEAAKKESRKGKYAEKYAEYIKWLKNVPEFVKNRFLKDMERILTTGDKQFSANMESYLQWHIKNPKFNGTGAEVLRQNNAVQQQKEKALELLKLIEKIDGKNIHSSWSAYHFVNSVMNSIERQNGMTPKQMEAMNKVSLTYSHE